ncbi:MAG TPA: 3-methyl-2-oxobutanoate hydroxymethyltransferase [Negativicutes bacterium]|mgnify:CR=1 FL=1|nr:3-methyl-2-oxobutanoate hydroxymethyltransferase [Negativicutes bacterium]
MEPTKKTLLQFRDMKQQKEKITVLTAYDYPTARLVEQAGMDMILIGDSLGMVVLGYDSTVPVTMEDMLHHAKAVRRGAAQTFLVVDMPFMSYNVSTAEAIRNAGRLMQEGGADAVKLEGGETIAATAAAIVRAGIPVMGHIGLTPQTATQLGGFKVQGRDRAAAESLLRDARAIERAGAFAITLEAMPQQLAAYITAGLSIPTIGIGAGAECDGQVLVLHDLIGLFPRFVPKFVKQYAQLSANIVEACRQYQQEVRQGAFPAAEHCFNMNAELLAGLLDD